jgi:hypothetical protein
VVVRVVARRQTTSIEEILRSGTRKQAAGSEPARFSEYGSGPTAEAPKAFSSTGRPQTVTRRFPLFHDDSGHLWRCDDAVSGGIERRKSCKAHEQKLRN